MLTCNSNEFWCSCPKANLNGVMKHSNDLRNLGEVLELEEARGDIPELYNRSQQPVLNPCFLWSAMPKAYEKTASYLHIYSHLSVCTHCALWLLHRLLQKARKAILTAEILCSTSICCPIIYNYFLFLMYIWNSFIIKLHTYRTASKPPHSSCFSVIHNTLLSIIWIRKLWDQNLGKTEER